jgi:ABC-type transporter Mla MlaB component
MTTSSLTLPLELTVFTATETHQQWLMRWHELPREGPVGVDGAGVEQVDAAGLQLLVSLRRTLDHRSQDLHLLQASDALTQACQIMGCGQLLSACAVEGAGS